MSKCAATANPTATRRGHARGRPGHRQSHDHRHRGRHDGARLSPAGDVLNGNAAGQRSPSSTASSATAPPTRSLGRRARRVLRGPTALYDVGLGWILGHRFLMLTHRGRRTGRLYRTVLEVLQWDREAHEAVVMAGLGKRAQWYRKRRRRRFGRGRHRPRALAARDPLPQRRRGGVGAGRLRAPQPPHRADRPPSTVMARRVQVRLLRCRTAQARGEPSGLGPSPQDRGLAWR